MDTAVPIGRLAAWRVSGAMAPSGSATVTAMVEVAGSEKADLVEEEARLARAAASGDGSAFATLYERYAQRAYNLAFRLSDSEEDAADAVQEAFLNVMRRLPELGEARKLAFGSYLFTATRNATYDILHRAQRTRPTDSISEGAVPIGSGAGGLGLDPGDPEDDPDRRQLLASQREEIRAANAQLPERQREALALRELEDLSYDEIAELMEMNRNSVAQLISRARINLRDELRGTALASVAAVSPECERALPLLAMRDDSQLDPGSADAARLASHLAGCERCRLASEAMQEAGVSYRAWIPLAVAPFLLRETMARAARLTGSEWDEVIERRADSPPSPATIPGLPPAYRALAATAKPRRRRLVAALLGLAALLLAGGALAVAVGGDDEPAPAQAAPATVDAPATPAPREVRRTKVHDRHRSRSAAKAVEQPGESEFAAPPSPPIQTESRPGGEESTGKSSAPAPSKGSHGVGDSQPADQAPKEEGGEARTPPAPAPVDPPTEEAPPPAEEPPTEERPPRGEEPPREEPPPREGESPFGGKGGEG